VNRAEVVEQVKRFAPAGLKVTLRDGTEKPVAVPKAGNRWARTQQVLDSLAWVTIECLDKDGRLLGVIEDDDDADAELFDEESGGNVAMARVLLEVMRTTMKEVRSMFGSQLDGMARVMGSMADGQTALAESYKLALQVQQQHVLSSGAPSQSENAEMMQMLQMLMMTMRTAQQQKGG